MPPVKLLKNEKGVAMMMAMVTFLILSILVGEIAYESGVYTGVVWRQVDNYRAKLLARSALRLALLQVRATEKARAKAKAMGLGDNASVVEQIWQTPLILPPPTPPGMGEADKKSVEDFGNALGLDGVLSISISGANTRFNLNQLVMLKESTNQGTSTNTSTATGTDTDEEKNKKLEESRQGMYQFAEELLEQKRRDDDAFRDRYGYVRGEVLMRNILAWIDPKTQVDGDGQQKTEYYARLETPYALKDAPMASETELYMVKGFDDGLGNLFADHFTTQITSGFNVNQASSSMLRALIPEIGEVEAERIQQRKNDQSLGGNFKDAADFWNFLGSLGNFEEAKKRLEASGITILGPETSYQVTISAKSGKAQKLWLAKIGPLPASEGSTRTNTNTATNSNTNTSTDTSTNTSTNTGTQTQNNDSESLRIIYLKAD